MGILLSEFFLPVWGFFFFFFLRFGGCVWFLGAEGGGWMALMVVMWMCVLIDE